MNQRAAFRETMLLAGRQQMPEHSDIDPSLGYEHMRSMWDRIEAGEFSESKLGRWLGWAQAALVSANVGVTLEDVKQINLRWAGDECPNCDADPTRCCREHGRHSMPHRGCILR